MHSSMQQRHGGKYGGAGSERDDELTLFHDLRKREIEKKKANLSSVDKSEFSLANKLLGQQAMYRRPVSASLTPKSIDDLLVSSEFDKTDYNWLLTPPHTPLFTTLDNNSPGATLYHKDMAFVQPLPALRISSVRDSQPPSKLIQGHSGLRQTNSGSTATSRRKSSLAPSSGSNTPSVPSTPTGRENSSSSNRSAASSRSTTPSTRPITPRIQQNHGASTTTTRSTSVSKASSLPSKSTSSSRGSSPTSRTPRWQPSAMPGFSTEPPPNLRTTLPERSISNSRGASVERSISNSRGSSVERSISNSRGASVERSTSNSRGASVERSTSNSRGSSTVSRAGLTTSRTAQVDATDASTRSRRQSSSPSVTRGDGLASDRSIAWTNKSGNGMTETSGRIVFGSKMVEKLVQARRSAALVQSDQPTRRFAVLGTEDQSTTAHKSQVKRQVAPVYPNPSVQEEQLTTVLNSQMKRPGKPTPPPTTRDTSNVGRNVSKKSPDMALKHMDIRQNAPDGLGLVRSNIPPPSSYGVPRGVGRGSLGNFSRSSVVPSSVTGSGRNMNMVPDPEGSDDEFDSEIGSKSSPRSPPASVFSRYTSWIRSPDYKDDSVEIMQLFRQGIERFPGAESPLVCEHGWAGDCVRCKSGI
eukprot:c53811_g1_i1 orf=208-2130(+)